jgi:hypothetical protein
LIIERNDAGRLIIAFDRIDDLYPRSERAINQVGLLRAYLTHFELQALVMRASIDSGQNTGREVPEII